MADSFVPPQAVRNNAKRGLELRRKYNRGGTEVGVARARDLMNGSALSLSTIKRMNSFFARHEVDKKGEGWGKDSAGYIAWLLWGGDAGWSWARGIIRQQESKEKATMSDLTTAFFEIQKADRNPDGTLMVFGKATDDSVDIDQQICDADWLDRAMPVWFKTGGNIREQHSNIAAGVAKEYEAKGAEHFIRALVVDPISVKKVENGVLKGFSIGIKNPRITRDAKAANGRIIDGQIVEVSLVDRPANPNCQLVLAKSAVGEENLVQSEDLIEKKEDEETDYTTLITPRKGEPADKELYNRVKAEAKEKFDVYPSAVANAWVVREYKKRGGKYQAERKKKALQSDPTALKGDLMELVKDIIDLAKNYENADIVKFDQKTYDNARKALAELIAIEAEEMGEGDNEEASLQHLLSAVHHLFAWYAGEQADGEVIMESEIEMSAKLEDKEKGSHDKKDKDMDNEKEMTPKKGETFPAFKARCKEAGLSDMKARECFSKYMMSNKELCPQKGESYDGFKMRHKELGMPEDDMKQCFKNYNKGMTEDKKEKSADVEKCLECGCNQPGQTHGLDKLPNGSNVSTAVIVSPSETPKSAEADEPTEETKVEEVITEEQNEISADEKPADVEAIVEQVVEKATQALKVEIASLVSAKEAAESKAVSLESELAHAKSLAVAGGPKRTAKAAGSSNELISKAATYKAKANATTDPLLAKGYSVLADKYYAEAQELLTK